MTKLFLWEMLALADELFSPSLCNLNQSFEGWAHRKGLLRQIQRLEAEAFLERQPGGAADRVYRLTPKGRIAALGGKDPETLWNRSWDGRWRLLMFDLPERPQAPRARLRKVLREHGLGCLQGSVWITPDPLTPIRKRLRGDRHPSSLLLFEGVASGGEKPLQIVNEAWDFDGIHMEWAGYASILEQGRPFLKSDVLAADVFREWAEAEYAAWLRVLEVDPLLPGQLLPRRYRGRQIWKRRMTIWKGLAQHLKKRGFPTRRELRH